MNDLSPRLMAELTQLRAEKASRILQEEISRELEAAGLHRDNSIECSAIFMEDIYSTTDPIRRKAKIHDRAEIIAEAAAGISVQPGVVLNRTRNRTQRIAAYSSSPLQESGDGTAAIPPASAPLALRMARFIGK